MTRALRCAGVGLSLLAALACSHRAELPPPALPLTPSANEPFRRAAPAPLEGMPVWTPPAVQMRLLANGMHVVVVERHERPIVSVRYANRAAIQFSGQYPPGLSVLTGDALLEGTLIGRDEVIKNQRIAGIRPRVYTSPDGTTVELDLPVLAFAPAVEMIAGIVRSPELGAEGIRIAARKQYDSLFEQSHRNSIATPIAIGVLYGDKHPWAVDMRTTQKELEHLTTADVQAFYRRVYVPDASALVVVGDVSAEKVFALAERHFGDWQAGRPTLATAAFEAVPQRREVHALLAGGAQTRLQLVQPAVGTANPSFHAFGVMAQILEGYSSRSNTVLRHELGATYGVRAQLIGFREAGFLRLALAVENAQVYRAAASLRTELKRLQEEEVSATEMEAAKSAYLASFDMSSTRSLADLLAMLDMQGIDPDWLTRIEAEVAAITPQQVRALARAHFEPDRDSIIAIGNLHQTFRELRPLGTVKAYEIGRKP